MFRLEFMKLLSDYKKETSSYEKNRIRDSLVKLIDEHAEDYEDFTSQHKDLLSEEDKKILAGLEMQKEDPEPQSDFEILKRYYERWLVAYQRAGQITQENEAIIKEIISFYAKNRLDILKRLFDIKDSEYYEKFKAHLKNQLRAYYAQQIKLYMKSDSFTRLNFIQKYRKRNELFKLANEIGNYNFEPKKMEEVLR